MKNSLCARILILICLFIIFISGLICAEVFLFIYLIKAGKTNVFAGSVGTLVIFDTVLILLFVIWIECYYKNEKKRWQEIANHIVHNIAEITIIREENSNDADNQDPESVFIDEPVWFILLKS